MMTMIMDDDDHSLSPVPPSHSSRCPQPLPVAPRAGISPDNNTRTGAHTIMLISSEVIFMRTEPTSIHRHYTTTTTTTTTTTNNQQ